MREREREREKERKKRKSAHARMQNVENKTERGVGERGGWEREGTRGERERTGESKRTGESGEVVCVL